MNINQLLFGTLLLLLTACSGDKAAEKQMDLLTGHWDLVEGKRNGKVTESLRDTYFEFTQEGKMSTNLPFKGGMDSPFEIKENTIIQTIVNDIQIKYAIEELTPQTLKLSTNLRGYDFNFDLQKAEKEGLSMVEPEEFLAE